MLAPLRPGLGEISEDEILPESGTVASPNEDRSVSSGALAACAGSDHARQWAAPGVACDLHGVARHIHVPVGDSGISDVGHGEPVGTVLSPRPASPRGWPDVGARLVARVRDGIRSMMMCSRAFGSSQPSLSAAWVLAQDRSESAMPANNVTDAVPIAATAIAPQIHSVLTRAPHLALMPSSETTAHSVARVTGRLSVHGHESSRVGLSRKEGAKRAGPVTIVRLRTCRAVTAGATGVWPTRCAYRMRARSARALDPSHITCTDCRDGAGQALGTSSVLGCAMISLTTTVPADGG